MKFFFVVVMFMSMVSFVDASDGIVGSIPTRSQVLSEHSRTVFQNVERRGRYQDGLPSGIMKMIFTYATMAGCDPRMLEASVCKFWYTCFRNEQAVPEKDFTSIPFTTKKKDYFMETCMRRYREALLAQAVFSFTEANETKVEILRKKQIQTRQTEIPVKDFPDGACRLSFEHNPDKGTFVSVNLNRTIQGSIENYIITTNRDVFSKTITAEGEPMIYVILVAPNHLVRDLMPTPRPFKCHYSYPRSLISIFWRNSQTSSYSVAMNPGTDIISNNSLYILRHIDGLFMRNGCLERVSGDGDEGNDRLFATGADNFTLKIDPKKEPWKPTEYELAFNDLIRVPIGFNMDAYYE